MANPNLPNPQLAETARLGLRKLARLEDSLLDLAFEGRVLDIVAVANGHGTITSLVVPAARIPSTNVPDLSLAEWIRQALDSALGDVRRVSNDAVEANRPSLPNTGGPKPPSIADKAQGYLHDPYTGTSAGGQIAVTVTLDWRPSSVTIAGSFYTSPDRLQLGERVREAANVALATARHEFDCAAAGLALVLIQEGL